MFLDNIDLLILKAFCTLKTREEKSTWVLMRTIYPKGKTTEHMQVKQKMNKLVRYGLLDKEGNPQNYVLDSKKVILKKIKFDGQNKEAICFQQEKKWVAFEI